LHSRSLVIQGFVGQEPQYCHNNPYEDIAIAIIFRVNKVLNI